MSSKTYVKPVSLRFSCLLAAEFVRYSAFKTQKYAGKTLEKRLETAAKPHFTYKHTVLPGWLHFNWTWIFLHFLLLFY